MTHRRVVLGRLLTAVLGRPIVLVCLSALAVLFILPFCWMLVASTFDFGQLYSWPPRFVPGGSFLQNITRASELASFARSYLNSAMVACARVLLTAFFCGLAGFAFAKFSFPGKKVLFLTMLATMMVPSTVTVVPLFILMSRIEWTDRLLALIVPEVAYAFGIFWITQYIKEVVRDELIDSARIEGCSDFAVFRCIVVPIVLPGLAVLVLLTFMNSWNEFIKPFVLIGSPTKYTLTVHMMTMMSNRPPDVPATLAAACLGTIPILVLFILANRMFIEGLTYGALKE